MFIRVVKKKNGPDGKIFSQFSLVQNARVNGKVKQRSILYLGSDPTLSDPYVRNTILVYLHSKIFGQPNLFPQNLSKDLETLGASFYAKYLENHGTDPVESAVSIPPSLPKAEYFNVDINQLNFQDVKSFGAENLCLQTLIKLKIDKSLEHLNWSQSDIDLAKIAICARAIFASSEYKTSQYLQDNSELCSLINKDHKYLVNHKQLYKIADMLFDARKYIDSQLYNRVCNLFDLNDRLLIFDISNTYFESPKFNSELANFGRSKEKRTDCKLVVFTGVVNTAGFIKHSRIYEGNKPDVSTLEDMINDLGQHASQKQTIVIDAGIASEENLTFLRLKGYDYVCVSRGQLKEYEIDQSNTTKVQLKDKAKTNIDLRIVKQNQYPDTWMYIKSPGKAKKETSMEAKLSERFVEELQSVKDGLQKKKTVKNINKIYEKIGRLKQKHKRVASLFTISIIAPDPKDIIQNAKDIEWEKNIPTEKDDKLKGIYFLRTTLDTKNESALWQIYNCIREVESTFRCLKSDLNMRPIHHQLDTRISSHIYLTILAYQLVNSIRYQLKLKGLNYDWKNILRLMSTQIIQTVTLHGEKKTIHLRKPSVPANNVIEVYKACDCENTIKPKREYVVYH